MPAPLHPDLVGPYNHVLHNFTYANAAARLAAVLLPTDIGKVALQSDDNTYWILLDDAPLTWHPITGVPLTTQVIAGDGLTGGGALSSNVTLNVAANPDGSIVVNANDIQVGVINDTQHGLLGGGTAHQEATGMTAGFLGAAMFTNITNNLPTADQKAALAGTSGLPSAVNPYVTTEDFRFSPQQVVYVAKNASVITGKWYNTVGAAITYAAGVALTNNRILIQVFPGEYTESPFTIPSFAYIRGTDSWGGVHLITNDNSNHFITLSANSGAELLAVTGPTGAGFAAFNQTATGITKLNTINIRAGYYGVWAHAASSMARIHCWKVMNDTGTTPNTMFRATDYGFIMTMLSGPMVGAGWTYGWYADGANASMTLDVCPCRCSGGTAIYANNSATIRGLTVAISSATTGVRAGNNGASLTFAGSTIRNCTTDIQTDSNLGVTSWIGSFDSSKLSITSGSTFNTSASDNTSANKGQYVFGELYIGNPTVTTPLTSYIRANRDTGHDDGGALTYGVGALDVDVASGSGFFDTVNGLKKVSWNSATLTLPDNTNNITIYVNSAGTVSQTTASVDMTQNVVLGAAVTYNNDVVFLATHGVELAHHKTLDHEYAEHVIGPINVSGGAVTQFGAPPSLQFEVDASNYYIMDNERDSTASGGATTFNYWYKDGGGGWKVVTGQTALDDGFYDDSSGTLAAIPVGKFKRDLAFVAVNDTGTEFHVVYGQETWAAAVDATNNPVVPDVLQSDSCRLAAFVIQESSGDITTLIDQRPRLGQLSSGSTAVTAHNGLSGLGVGDDHPQYQLRSEEGVANGYASLDASALVPPTQLDLAVNPGTDISNAAGVVGASNKLARENHTHKVLSGTPVAIGTANSAGLGPNLALNDHVHDHGNQTVDTHHALAVAGVSHGFFDKADKTKLDGISASADNTLGANVGVGTGQIFRDKTGSTLNFKTLVQGSNITLTNNADDVTIAATITPGGADTQIQFNDGGVLGGDADLTWDKTNNIIGLNGTLNLTQITSPAAASANNLRLYALDMAGQPILSGRMAFNEPFHYQAALWCGGKRWIYPNGGTGLSSQGVSTGTTGTISHPALANTNRLTQMYRVRAQTANPVGNSAGIRATAGTVNINAAGFGGFMYVSRFALTTTSVGVRAFNGLTSSTAALTNADPSTQLNIIAMAFDSGQTTWRIMHNDGAGAATTIDLGANFPVDTTTIYDLFLFCQRGGTSVGYLVINKSTGNTTSGTLAADLPGTSTFLAMQLWVNNGANTGQPTIDTAYMYLEDSC
jgi:hypothetical protein